jgi:hypothetical protein
MGNNVTPDLGKTKFVQAHGKKFAMNPNGCVDFDFRSISLRMGLHYFYDSLHRIFERICKHSMLWNTRCHNMTATSSNSGVYVVEIREPVSLVMACMMIFFLEVNEINVCCLSRHLSSKQRRAAHPGSPSFAAKRALLLD